MRFEFANYGFEYSTAALRRKQKPPAVRRFGFGVVGAVRNVGSSCASIAAELFTRNTILVPVETADPALTVVVLRLGARTHLATVTLAAATTEIGSDVRFCLAALFLFRLLYLQLYFFLTFTPLRGLDDLRLGLAPQALRTCSLSQSLL